jgi:hypothetical protein
MPTDHHLDPEEDALAHLGYETEDVEYRTLGKSILWFLGFVVFCGVAGVIIFFLFIGKSPAGAWEAFTHPPGDTTPFVNRMPASPNPLLQTNVTARTDIRDLRRDESLLLHGGATWVDKDKGVVRIPIDHAVDLYLQRMGSNPSQPTSITSGTPPVVKEPPVIVPDITAPSPHG